MKFKNNDVKVIYFNHERISDTSDIIRVNSDNIEIINSFIQENGYYMNYYQNDKTILNFRYNIHNKKVINFIDKITLIDRLKVELQVKQEIIKKKVSKI